MGCDTVAYLLTVATLGQLGKSPRQDPEGSADFHGWLQPTEPVKTVTCTPGRRAKKDPTYDSNSAQAYSVSLDCAEMLCNPRGSRLDGESSFPHLTVGSGPRTEETADPTPSRPKVKGLGLGKKAILTPTRYWGWEDQGDQGRSVRLQEKVS